MYAPAIVAEAVVNGLLTGSVYALIALGLTLVYGVLHIINFAHGALLTCAMFAVWVAHTALGLDPYLAIPLLTPLIFFNLVLQMIFGFTVFTSAFIISGGTGAPLDSLLLYSLYLYQKGFKDFQMGYAAAMAWALLVVIGGFTVLIFRSSSHWVYYESGSENDQ